MSRHIELRGPFPLTPASIKEHVGCAVSPGVVLLGRLDQAGRWLTEEVDRSDSHVRARLWGNVGSHSHFWFRLCPTPEKAYRLHCALFHRINGHDRTAHPCLPDGTALACPICATEFAHGQTDKK